MTRLDRFVVAGLIAVLLAAPVLSAHALLAHLSGSDHAHWEHLPVVLGLVVLAFVPVIGATRLAAHMRNGRRALAALGPFEAARVDGFDVLVFASEAPVFFTAGIFRPRVYAGSASLALPGAVCRAAIEHEAAHCDARDPAWRLALRALELALPLPFVQSAVALMVARSEFRADAWALRHGVGRADLFEAIAVASGNAPAVGLASASAMNRLEVLATGHGGPPRGLAVVFVVPALVLAALPLLAHLPAWLTASCS